MTSAPARIRRAHADDIDALLALEQHFPGDRMSRRAIRHLLGSASAHLWIAGPVAAPLGALVLLTRRNSRWARLYSVVVSPQARGQGLGRRLVIAAEREARRLGCVGLSLEVRKDNLAARGLYDALGYQLHARLVGYYEDGAAGVRLRRRFDGPAASH
ncbi:GNAT family N-acetyltransferase [Solimonas terrae]|uniref:GNAT family N-acetyltransferase n=1 Tax=Solimonas terrae TaxID=1396819 RepID=A0A6M2BT56_9GAMM|nr:N-acetyltransferase [Solimonas terrae]NGY05658.1 GNAT family N-acetyltransferase [Solimonas terrae]